MDTSDILDCPICPSLVYDEHIIGLHQMICERHLVGVKGASQGQDRVNFRLGSRPNLRNGPRCFPTEKAALTRTSCKWLIPQWWAHQGSNLGPAD